MNTNLVTLIQMCSHQVNRIEYELRRGFAILVIAEFLDLSGTEMIKLLEKQKHCDNDA